MATERGGGGGGGGAATATATTGAGLRMGVEGLESFWRIEEGRGEGVGRVERLGVEGFVRSVVRSAVEVIFERGGLGGVGSAGSVAP